MVCPTYKLRLKDIRYPVIWLFLIFIGSLSFAKSADDFSRLPQAYSVKLSPDGNYIAYLRNMDDFTLLVSVDLKKNKSYALLQTNNEKYKITWFKWANNEKIVFGTLFPERRFGVNVNETRLMIVDKDKSNAEVLLVPRNNDFGSNDFIAQVQDNVIDWLPEEPDHILVAVDYDVAIYPTVYKVNLKTKTRKVYKRAVSAIVDWKTDLTGKVRVGTGYDSKASIAFTRVLDVENNKWHKIWEREVLVDPPFVPLGFDVDPNILYLRADHNGRGAIFKMDTRYPDQSPELVFSDPKYDIEGSLIYTEKDRRPVGVYHLEQSVGRLYWDPVYEGLEKGLSKAFPGKIINLSSFSKDEKKYILAVYSDTSPFNYYLGDREKGSLEPILSSYPQVDESKLTPKKSIAITMRDGLEIEAFLTMPESDIDQKLPAIIFPHGGPISRDYINFDYWTQYFAAKGIAVLQPNFRGSSGYGHEFMLKALKNYGKGMQDDLVDSTQWLIETGKVDPKRICIVGASYGGYAALTATFQTPSLYQCAISFAGVSDLEVQRDSYLRFTNSKIAKKQIGFGLDEYSPYFNVEKFKAPILLVHGNKDRIVPPIQSRKMAEKLKSNEKVYEYIELENGSHFLLKQKNRTILFNAMDSFLDKYLL